MTIKMIMNIGTTIALLLATGMLCSCGNSNAEAEKIERMNMQKIENATNAASNSFNSMLRDRERFSQGTRTPQRADLDVFRMAMQSTTLDLERVAKILDENPSLVEQARNLWVGRVQESLTQIEDSGMLVNRDGPLTSKLGETFGEERIEQDVNRLFAATKRIQSRLEIPDSAAPTDTP